MLENEKKPKILIVDDEQDNIRVLAEVLKGQYKLIGARNGKVALECANSDEPPDIILLDIMMPDMDGFEVLRNLKDDPKTQDIPVIFITAMGKDDNEAQSLERGAVDYITKPINSAIVNARVRLHLELKQYREQLEQMVYKRTEELSKSNKRYREEITERKKAEQQVQLQASALEAAANAVVITDINGLIQWINKAYTKLTGYAFEESIGQSLPLYKSEKQDEAFYSSMWDEITSGEVWHGQLINRRKDNSLYMEEMTITPVRDTKKLITHFIAIKQDITHEIEMEKKLRQAQKMEAIGTLTGGIAHDFNNILYAILGYSEMAINAIDPESKAYKYIERVVNAGKRAADLVEHILTFSRNVDQERQPIQIQYVIKEALKLLKGTLPATIKIQQNIDVNCRPIFADPTQIHQVIMNLCTNAYHAMRENGGILQVKLAEIAIDAKQAAKHPELVVGQYVRLTVKDTGHGMEESVIQKIFEPFFTTKKVGEGTGLGLSTVLGIVKAHKAAILVNSKPGQGAQFDVLFPAYEEVQITEEKVEAEPEISEGSESVMVVDDEKSLVQMNEILLESLGYEVRAFDSSIRALEAFKEAPENFDVIITDQTMPDLTGVQMAQEMLKIRNDIPIILCTGYSEAISPEQAKEIGIREYLKKPIIGHELAKTIRQILQAETS